MNKRDSYVFAALLLCAACCLWPAHARGQSITWSGSTSPLWNVSGNWFGGAQPGTSNTVLFDATSTLNLTGTLGANFTVGGLTIGSTPGNVSISGNVLTLGTTGIDMSSASNSTNNATIGSTLNLNATSNVNVASGRTLALGAVNIRTGTVTLNGAGSVTYGNTFTVGSNGGTVALNIESGSLSTPSVQVFTVGNSAGVNATVNQSGGSVSLSTFYLGQSALLGTYNLSGGTLTVAYTQIGNLGGSRGAFVMSGGTLTQSTSAFAVGLNGPGTYTQSAGSASVNILRMSSTSTLTISGGLFTAATSDSLAASGSNRCTIVLSGGTTTLPALPTVRGTNATLEFIFDGGVLRPRASSTVYMQGLTNAYLTNNGAVIDTNGQNITIAQALINGTAAGTAGVLFKTGSGGLTLAGSNSYTGQTTVAGGVLIGGTANAFGSSAPLAINSGTVNINGFGQTIGALSGSAGTLITTNNVAGSATLTTSFASGTSTFGGSIANNGSGTVAFTKSGAGTQIFSGSNTFSGPTSITAGQLRIDSAGSINSTLGITVNGAGAEFKYNSATPLSKPLALTQGTLSGTGTINTPISIGANAIIAPGNSPGEQNYTSLLDWGPLGTYRWEVNSLTGTAGTNWDLVNVTLGTFDLSVLSHQTSGKFFLDLITLGTDDSVGPLAIPYSGGSHTFRIANYDPSNFLLPDGFSNTANADLTSLFSISLANWQGTKPDVGNISVRINSTSNGIDLVIVPEPDTVIFAGIGIVMAGWSVRNRRRCTHVIETEEISADNPIARNDK